MSEQQTKPICKNCRWWDAHSQELRKGTCRHVAEGVPHRARRIKLPNGSYALMDSFEFEDTRPQDSCLFWAQ